MNDANAYPSENYSSIRRNSRNNSCDGVDYGAARRPSLQQNCLQTASASGSNREVLPNERWSVFAQNNRRLCYVDHETQTTHWIPPPEAWQCTYGLPYGWEIAVDTTGKPYFLNHVEQLTAYVDPRLEDEIEPPEPRDVVLGRHPQVGFGFVAGSEKPVVVRFVTEGGPSADKLLPGDEILTVNGEDVREAAKDHVVNLVRNCADQVYLTVCQPRSGDSSLLKSALLSATKRARLKNNPSRVRFAEGVLVGTPPDTPCGAESCVALMPNVLRVFLENAQTKSFKYDQTTTVEDVIESLREKLCLRSVEYFALTLEHPQGPRSHKLSLLRQNERLSRVAARPGSQHFRCLLRVVFIPADPLELLKNDPLAFEYLYQQCVNDVVQGRYAFEMRYEACLRLAALHMQQCALDNHHCGGNGRVSLKAIEKEYGLSTFLPTILLENVKLKEIRKHLRYYLKRDVSRQPSLAGGSPTNSAVVGLENDTNSSFHASLSPSQVIKLKYVHMLGHLPSFGGRTFYVTFKDTNTDMIMQVGPKTGITVRNTGRTLEPTLSLLHDLIGSVSLSTESEVLKMLSIKLRSTDQSQTLDFLVDKDDIEDLVLYIQGYYYLYTRTALEIHWEEDLSDPSVPPYFGLHSVKISNWNFASAAAGNENKERNFNAEALHQLKEEYPHGRAVEVGKEVFVDLSRGPPKFADVLKSMSQQKTPANTTDETAVGAKLVAESETVKRVDVSETVKSTLADVDEQEESAEHEDKILHNIMTKRGRRTNEEDAYVRKTFLRARDSLMIRNRSGSRSKDIFRSLSKERDASFSAAELSSVSGSDTESLSTPSESPIHKPPSAKAAAAGSVTRPSQLTTPSGNISFGLQSPDTLPCSLLSDVELQQIITSCGLEGQQLEDLLLLFPDNFCTDSEIIDLTMLPPPKTPDDDTTVVNIGDIKPPPPFADPGTGESPRKHSSERPRSSSVAVLHASPLLSPRRNVNVPGERRRFSVDATTARKLVRDIFAVGKSSTAAPPSTAKNYVSAIPVKTDKQQQQHPQRPIISLSSEKRDFEQFLARSVIPPPPHVPLEEGEDLLKKAENQLAVLQEQRHIQYRAPILKQQHQKQPVIFEENPTEIENQNGGVWAGTTGQSDRLDRQQTSHDKASRSSSTLLSAGSRDEHFDDLRAPTAAFESFDSDAASSTANDFVVTKISLKSFTGLEETDHEAPEVTVVSLRNFIGLETSPSRSASSESGGRKPSLQPTSPMRPVASVALRPAGPSATDATPTIFEKITSADSTPISADSYNQSPSRTPNLRRPNYNYYYRRRSSLNADPDAVVSMWPESNDQEGAAANGRLVNGVTGDKPDFTVAEARDFSDAQSQVLKLLDQLKDQIDGLPMKSPKRVPASALNCKKGQYKSSTLNEAQQFASAGKQLVRSVASSPSVVDVMGGGKSLFYLNQSVERARVFYAAAAQLIKALDTLFHAQTFGAKVREVLVAFERTLDAAKEARGKPLGDDEMKRLMRQSTTLAATLTQLIRTAREI